MHNHNGTEHNCRLLEPFNEEWQSKTRYFEAELAMHTFGVGTRYGNTAMTGRIDQNLTRRKSKAKQKKEKEVAIDENVLNIAQELVKSGVAIEVVENFLTMKTQK